MGKLNEWFVLLVILARVSRLRLTVDRVFWFWERLLVMKIVFAFIVGLVVAQNASTQSDELTLEIFEKLHAEIVPKDEVWKSIPWHADLISAQAAAIKQNKPMFIWSMDGHPLGCT